MKHSDESSTFLSFKAKKILIKGYIFSNFNYSPFVLMYCNVKSKIKALRFLISDDNLILRRFIRKNKKRKNEFKG